MINCQQLEISFGGRPLLEKADLQIARGERIGLLGRNGEGKSTLLKIIAGDLNPDRGVVHYAAGVRTGHLEQQVPSGIEETVRLVIGSGLPPGADGQHPVERLCSLLDLDPGDRFTALSGGRQRKALLGRALAGEPDLLLLDEPTNHLDIGSIRWLEQFLTRFPGSLLFVTHDRSFLQAVATRIVELDRGRLNSWDCDFPTYLQRKEAFLAGEETQWAQFDKKLAQEEAWLRQGIKARRTRNEGRVRALERLRRERAARRERSGEVRINIQDAPRSGTKVIAAKNLGFAYPGDPDEKTIVQDLTTTIMRGDRVGVIGPNGCGKTTLLRLLLGTLPPTEGNVTHGTALEVAYFDQHRHQLDEARTVFDNVADGNDRVTVDGKTRHVISYLGDFLFSAERARQAVSSLSGGERNRLLLARLFTQPSNVLVLDEPTNDLDIETLELLEAMLLEYSGTVLVVSHDRRFLDNLCTSTLAFDADGEVREVVGGYSDWLRVAGVRTKKPRQAKAAAPRERSPERKKLSNRERERWVTLPRQIEAWEQELAELHAAMNDPAFFRGDRETIRSATERARRIPIEIDQALEEWTALDERS